MLPLAAGDGGEHTGVLERVAIRQDDGEASRSRASASGGGRAD